MGDLRDSMTREEWDNYPTKLADQLRISNKITKYRKKPVVIQAIQFDGSIETASLIQRWSNKKVESDPFKEGISLIVHTLEGDMICSEGDYIIKGVKNEYYPCKPDIFEATYEKVN